jgi:hypothetical protein
MPHSQRASDQRCSMPEMEFRTYQRQRRRTSSSPKLVMVSLPTDPSSSFIPPAPNITGKLTKKNRSDQLLYPWKCSLHPIRGLVQHSSRGGGYCKRQDDLPGGFGQECSRVEVSACEYRGGCEIDRKILPIIMEKKAVGGTNGGLDGLERR